MSNPPGKTPLSVFSYAYSTHEAAKLAYPRLLERVQKRFPYASLQIVEGVPTFIEVSARVYSADVYAEHADRWGPEFALHGAPALHKQADCPICDRQIAVRNGRFWPHNRHPERPGRCPGSRTSVGAP